MADLRVVTWNVRAAIGPGEPFPPAWWRHVDEDRLERIAAFIAALDADVVTLQEVTIMNVDGLVHDQPAALAARLRRHVRYGAAHAYPLVDPATGATIGSAMWGNAILTRGATLDEAMRGLPQPADSDVIEPAGSDDPAAGVAYGDAEPGHREPRCALAATVDGLRIVTTHLAYIGAEQRRRQVEAVQSLADGTNDATPPDDAPSAIVVTGDFNAAVESSEMGALRGAFHDAFERVGTPPGDPRRRSCGPLRIDHVFVRGLDVRGCRVATEAGELSDHWPVVVDLARP
ncbi:MAG TPA: endonuclease/exonuclease/phosphatase family protein [Candidatus Limnocylindrales bacterium]|nr:endonuclease/exonuclease/phosphatase family protein [Candidatus Limnocylindrales bacterium]